MLERCNSNMDIVLIFAGLFSAVNTAFIISTQPSPVDTTNALLIQLVQAYVPSTTQITTLPSPGYSSTGIWTQALAYASLAFSLLAAFGAVLGKQWLNYYKTNRYGRGSLEDRCKQRHRKFQKLQAWQLENVLQSFPFLLQISLLLFGVSLGAAMWTQQHVIAIVIITPTAFGLLFHFFTVLVSSMHPDCPFQTPISLLIQAIRRYLRKRHGARSQRHDESKSSTVTVSAMQWILDTTTDPNVLRLVLESIPTMYNQSDMDLLKICEKLRDMFIACFDERGQIPVLQDRALVFGKILIDFFWKYPNARRMLRTQKWKLWESWRALHLPQALEQFSISYDQMKSSADSQLHYQADTRTALRLAVFAGLNAFTDPKDRRLVSDGQFRLHLSQPKVERLMGCVEHFSETNDLDAAGDALLLVADGIATTTKTSSSLLDTTTCDRFRLRLTSLLQASHQSPQRWRCIVLRAACQVLESDRRHSDDKSFLQALLVAICPPVHIPSVCDTDDSKIADDSDPLYFTQWPEFHDLARSPLPEIQRIVLRALGALPPPNFDDPAEYTPYWRAFISVIGAGKCPAVHLSALHVACSAREVLATITAAEVDQPSPKKLLSELSKALLAAVKDDDSKPSPAVGVGQGAYSRGVTSSLTRWMTKLLLWLYSMVRTSEHRQDPGHSVGNLYSTVLAVDNERSDVYLHLVYALAKNPAWRHRLIEDGHVQTCIALIDIYKSRPFSFYLPAFFLRIAPQGRASSCCDTITDRQWWSLMTMAWYTISQRGADVFDDGIEIFPALAWRTGMCMPDTLSEEDLGFLCKWLREIRDKFMPQNPADNVISAVADLESIVYHRRNPGAEPQLSDILRICPRFRILVIGKTGVGVSSLINHVFGVQEALASNEQPGEVNINTEYISQQNDKFVLHFSKGFEPGEEDNVKIVQEFIQQRGRMEALGDRLHAVWLCFEVPRAGGWLLETGTEDFLQLKRDGALGNIPVVVVFTKYDKFIDRVARMLNDIDLDGLSDDAFKDHVKQRADAELHDICAQPLKKFAELDIPYATVSTKETHKEMIVHLIQTTADRVRRHVGSEAFMMLILAQRVDPKANMKVFVTASVGVCKKRYWGALASIATFRGRATWAFSEVLHTDILRVWDFRDPHHYLDSKEFKSIMADLVDKMDVGPIATPNRTFALGLSILGTVGGIVSALSGPAAPIVVPIMAIVVLGKWVYDVYQLSHVVLQLFIAYIVDLTLILQALYLLSDNRELSRRAIKLAVVSYLDSTMVTDVHNGIQKYDGHLPLSENANQDALNKIVELTELFSMEARDISRLRAQIPAFAFVPDEEW
ncbi:hypothetical protein K503DRAFT_749010 [Rhizopogon vinicolor AM-OR11-026]|uniref:DUF6535 domain-containing protein n=1 Tax=Rhizopogon vinicolor AM-OR11-026 TaxID=1314800 RepID=A0A1B7MKS9_9AGAM|nr:hypothetical protein K503DRAFT_749010 [Rhizopogon vinicolor AM-OR11-026]